MSDLRETLREIAIKHDERMKTEPRYALAFRYMQQATSPSEPSRHYDRDGYCDNPARGY
jgi:hypothetical protein